MSGVSHTWGRRGQGVHPGSGAEPRGPDGLRSCWLAHAPPRRGPDWAQGPLFLQGPSLWAAGRAGRPRGCSMIPDLLPAPHSRWSSLESWGSGREAGEQLGSGLAMGGFHQPLPSPAGVTLSKPGHRGRGNAPEEAGLELGVRGGPLLPRNPALPGAQCFQLGSCLLEIPWRPAGFDVWKATCSWKGCA